MNSAKIKPPILLKTLLDVIFWFTLIGLIIQIIFTGLYLFSDIQVNLTMNDYEITDFNVPFAIGLFIKILISAVFIYVIYIMRKVVRSFFKRKLFTPFQISGLKVMGRLIVFTVIAEMALNFFLRIMFESKVKAGEIADASFNSLWFILAIGLFFIVLSKAFSYARRLQQENELTV